MTLALDNGIIEVEAIIHRMSQEQAQEMARLLLRFGLACFLRKT